MATEKVLNTRIVLKHDELAAWEKSSITLKAGEVALARVLEKKPDKHGGYYEVPTYLMKVGDGSSTFSALNWVAATAADVYDWAKQSSLPVEISGSGNGIKDLKIEKTVTHPSGAVVIERTAVEAAGAAAQALQKANSHSDGLNTAMDTRVKAIEAIVGEGENTGSIGTIIDSHIDTKIQGLDNAGATAGVDNGLVIGSVSEKDGIISVSTKKLTAGDIPAIGTSKITGFDDAVAAKANKMGFATNSDLTAHTSDRKNPHGVTAAQVGLGNVTNKSESELKTAFTGSIASNNEGFVKGGAVHTALSAKLDAANLKVTNGPAVGNQFVTAVAEDGGNFTISRRGLAVADIPSITASKISDFDTEVSNNSDVSGLKTTVGGAGSGLVKDVNTLKEQISGVTGAMHFKGVKPSLPGTTAGYADGDVILVGNKEYVASGEAFVELGDTTQEGKDITAIKAQLNGIGSGDKAVSTAITSAVNGLKNGAVKDNADAIAALKNGSAPAKKADEATKATQDGNGAVIADTYETKTEANASHNAITGRLDVIEAESGAGSIKQALADAKSYANGLAGNYDAKGTGAKEAGKVLGSSSDGASANTIYGAKAAAKANTDAIAAINNPDTGILHNAKAYTDQKFGGVHKFANEAELDKIASGDKTKWDAAATAAGTALQSVKVSAGHGLKVTGNDTIGFADPSNDFYFVFDCGTATKLV